MEDITLKNLWKAQDEKLEKTMKLNLYLLESLQKQRAESKLNSLARFKGWAVGLGIIWVLFLGLLIYGNQLKNIYFTVSVGIILLFNIAAVAVYIKHIVLIRQLDYSESITNTQKNIFHLAGKDILSPYEMAIHTANVLGLDASLIEKVTADTFPEPVKRAKKSGLKIDKAIAELDYAPVSFEEGVRKTFEV